MQMSSKRGQGRRSDLPASERRRRQAQSEADRARTSAAEPTAPELQRRLQQSRADREQAELEDAVYNTIYGGDINMMSKGDW
jgi:hypothetical protein